MRRNAVSLLKYVICVITLILGTLLLKQVFGKHGPSVERFVDANVVQRDEQDSGVSVHLHLYVWLVYLKQIL